MKKIKIIASIVLVLAVSGWLYYSLNKEVKDSDILSRLSEIYDLPETTPIAMAVVSDPDTLKKQYNIFSTLNIKKGDRLIVYTDSTIVYDYLANKIIKVIPTQVSNPVNITGTSSAE